MNGFKMTLAPTKGELTGSLLLLANGRRVRFIGASVAERWFDERRSLAAVLSLMRA